MAEADKENFEFKVNGLQIAATQQSVKAQYILELAKQAGAMPGNPEDYILQGDKGEYGWDDWVDLLEDNIFITILNTSTQVA